MCFSLLMSALIFRVWAELVENSTIRGAIQAPFSKSVWIFRTACCFTDVTGRSAMLDCSSRWL